MKNLNLNLKGTSWLLSLTLFAMVSLGACADNKGDNCEKKQVHEGRISTHTRTSHIVHQSLSPEERELAKDHINNETAPGVSITTIDAEGAAMVNAHRARNPE